MNAKPVISCPRCLRQYEVEPSVTLAQCGVCKSHFQIAIATLSLPAEAVTLDRPLRPRCNFLYEATAQTALHVKAIFELAGEPYTTESVAEFVKWLPRGAGDLDDPIWLRERCNQIMKRACEAPHLVDKSRAQNAVMYFIAHALSRDNGALDLLIASFSGVLSVEYAVPRSKELDIIRKETKSSTVPLVGLVSRRSMGKPRLRPER